MLRTFNCGVGMIVVVSAEKCQDVTDALTAQGETVFPLGRMVPVKRARMARSTRVRSDYEPQCSTQACRRLHFRQRFEHGGAGTSLPSPDFPAEITCVISDKPTAGGLAKAQGFGIPTLVFERKNYASKSEHEAAILAALGELAPDIICLAGYMRLISGEFIAPYEGRIINIHPSLLPLFPGLHTHQRAIDSGMKITGCTVHFVTEGMDEGPVIGQAAVPVTAGDTADSLAARVLTVEHKLYPLSLRLLAEAKCGWKAGRSPEHRQQFRTPDAHLCLTEVVSRSRDRSPSHMEGDPAASSPALQPKQLFTQG